MISWSKKYCHVTKLYKSFESLKLQDIYKLELGKLMFKIVNNELPLDLVENFTALQDLHSYQGRNYRRCSRCNAPGPQHKELHIATFYCKIFSLKARVNLLLLNVILHQ